jgi:hypothetical protein
MKINMNWLALAVAAALIHGALIHGAASAAILDLQQSILNPTPGDDLFGQAVSLSGGRVLVGAQLDDTGGTDTGRAYLFNAATGALLQTFANPNPGGLPTSVPSDAFGLRVSLSGNLVLIGARSDETGTTFNNSGAAYLFNATTGGLLRTFTNPTPGINDNFGQAVAVSGNLALISAIGDANGSPSRGGSGAAYLFDITTGALLQTFLNPTPATGDNFGFAVALSGNRALVSTINDDTAAMNAGAAYLYDTDTGALLHTFLNPTPELNNTFGNNDNFGSSVALSSTKALVGAPNENVNGFHNGAAYLYDLATGTLLDTLLIPTPHSDTEEFLGTAVALSDDYALAGAPFRNKGPAISQKDLGGAFLFDANTGAFLQEFADPVPGRGDRFGFAVALDGDEALIGAQTDLVGGVVSGQVFYYAAEAAVPEPASIAVWACLAGICGVGAAARRKIRESGKGAAMLRR